MKGSAFGHWLAQRLTAVVLAFGTVVLAIYAVAFPPADSTALKAFVGHPLISVLLAFYLGALLWHAWIGLHDIVIDYIKPPAWRLTALAVLGTGLILCGLWGVRIFFGVAGS